MANISEQWIERAHYDISAAKAMLDSRHYLYVAFCCQQSIEKMLKAVITKRTNEFPPRIHNLVRLAETASLELTEEQSIFLSELSAFYIKTRYPEEIERLSAQMNFRFAKKIYEETQRIYQWLSTLL